MAGSLPHKLTCCSMLEASRRVQQEPPVRLGSLDPALADDVKTIASKALEKEPERR